jgi:hemoglobin/transferrin/lactoferrin receptor protein
VVARRLFAKEGDQVDRSAVDQLATPAATVVDVSVGWELSPALSVRAGIENALDETHWRWGDVQGLAATSPVLQRYSSPPRRFVATLRWSR